jgi:hypothetical protein
MAYIYAAEMYCDDCGKAICDSIQAEGHAPAAPADPGDEYSYDSGDYPKHVDGTAESDTPEHCASGSGCFNAIGFAKGPAIGAWLENALTCDGEDYVIEEVREEHGCPDVFALWKGYYDYLDFSVTLVCNDCQEDFDADDLDENNLCADCQ